MNPLQSKRKAIARKMARKAEQRLSIKKPSRTKIRRAIVDDDDFDLIVRKLSASRPAVVTHDMREKMMRDADTKERATEILKLIWRV
jgi:hypothetical protein